jgi:hypothetical protein
MSVADPATPPPPPPSVPSGFEPPPGYVLTPVDRPVRSRRLGLVAMIIAIALIVATVIVSIIIGIGAAPFAVHGAGGFSYNLQVGSSDPTESALAVASLIQGFGGAAFGIWAIVQGIVAVATRRGRAFGVVAIVLAALGPVITGVVTLIVVGTHLS